MIDRLPIPIKGLDARDALAIPAESCADCRNVRVRSGRVEKWGGSTLMGALSSFATGANAIKTIAQIWYLDTTTNYVNGVVALGYQRFHLWGYSSQTWGANLSSDSGNAEVPTLNTAYGRDYDVVSFLGDVYINNGGNPSSTQMVVYSPRATPDIQLLYDFCSSGAGVPFLTSPGGRFGCKKLLNFSNRLIAINTTEDSIQYETRIRWCANGNGKQWDSAQDPGAGLLEVYEDGYEELTSGFVLGERCYLTRSHEILELINTGQDSTDTVFIVFRVEPRIKGIGAAMPSYTAVCEQFAFILTPGGQLYQFDGSSIQVVSDPVRDLIPTLTIDRVVPYPARNEVWLVSLDGTVLAYDYVRQAWWRDSYGTITALNCIPATDVTAASDASYPSEQSMVYVQSGSAYRIYPTAANTRTDIAGRNTAGYASWFDTRDVMPQTIFGDDDRRGPRLDVEGVLYEVAVKVARSTSVTLGVNTFGLRIDTSAGGYTAPITAQAAVASPWVFEGNTITAQSHVDFGGLGLLPGMTITIGSEATVNGDYTVKYVEGSEVVLTTAVPLDLTSTTATLSSDGWVRQTVTSNPNGVARAFFDLPFSVARFRVYMDAATPLDCSGIIAYRWSAGGPVQMLASPEI